MAGLLQPVAYVSGGPDLSNFVMDLVITGCVTAGSSVSFRFFPGDDGYQSQYGTTVTFVTTAPLSAGGYLRLQFVLPGMVLLYRPPKFLNVDTPPAFITVATASTVASIIPGASCLVSLSATATCAAPIGTCFIGYQSSELVTPPSDVVPCAYQIVVPAPEDPTATFVTRFDEDGYAPSIHGAWRDAWQVLKWGPPWNVASALSDYESVVGAGEDSWNLVLRPGQLSVLAYRPYPYGITLGFGGQLVLVATAPIPANTVVYLWANAWPEDNVVPTPWYQWSSPCEVPTGTVIDFVNLGLAPAAASLGTLSVMTPVTSVVVAFSLYCVDTSLDPVPVTAVLPCSYIGVIPPGLEPGVSMLLKPWPDTASILAIPPCGAVPSSTALARQYCPERWLCQLPPAFRFPCGGPGCRPVCVGNVCAPSAFATPGPPGPQPRQTARGVRSRQRS